MMEFILVLREDVELVVSGHGLSSVCKGARAICHAE
jgi:hypothetical protein